MSVYSDCSRAAKQLAKKPAIFTEIDVVTEASHNKHWSKSIFKDAMRQAQMVVGQMYRGGKLVRFGPVVFNGEQDFAREAAKIVYAGVTIKNDRREPLVKEWKTPNGTFPALFNTNDTIGKVGNRPNLTGRNDGEPWDSQVLDPTSRPAEKVSRTKGAGPEVENNPVKILSERLRASEATNALLRRQLEEARALLADQDVAEEVRIKQVAGEVALDLVGELESAFEERYDALDKRLERLESINEASRRAILAAV